MAGRPGRPRGGLATWVDDIYMCGDFFNEQQWVGVSCNREGHVTQLNLTALDITLRGGEGLQFFNVFAAISNLTRMQSLVLSGVGLSGSLDSLQQPGLETFQDLGHLDISNNPGIRGGLPSAWFCLSALRTVNVSNTGVSGTLPNVYAALQQLQEFSALNCSELSGQLPPAWGLLNLEVLEITNSKLSGELPREWTDAAALRQAAAAAASSTLLDLVQWNGASPQSKVAGEAVVQSLPQPAARAGLAKLRVLDLSVSGSSTGKISGSQLDNFSAFEQLQVLLLAGHNFSSTLPPAWTRLQQLRVLDVSHNSLTGSIPYVYISMRQLAVLRVHNNQLVRAAGDLPDPWELMLGDGSKLQCLSVAGNKELLVDEAAAARLIQKAAERGPPLPLEVNAPGSAACNPTPWKRSS
uniref:Leucine-rich repeat-containing N-terminal plant-type domain-containing protein n=1 Tax=Tetradesmus obliquus TaxID=3088 RepID=A0A383VUL3_TETOB|eukprot:jgi/Sobl393_1/15911/SZX68610.1